MNFHSTPLSGLYVIETNAHQDHRGSFTRLFCAKEFENAGLSLPLAQMNTSVTVQKGAVRGMHFQKPPFAEIKLVRCLQGACYDVAIDLRAGSPTFLHYFAVELTAQNGKALYIPQGFAHGFQSLEKNTQLLYMHSEYYTKEAEGGVHHKDPLLNIPWPLPVQDLSERDESHPFLTQNFTGIAL